MMKILADKRAESPIEVLVTIMIMLLIMTAVWFVMGNFVDGFIFMIQQLPFDLLPEFQEMMGTVMWFATLFWALPSFIGAVLIVWSIKALIRRTGYTRAGDNYAYEDF